MLKRILLTGYGVLRTRTAVTNIGLVGAISNDLVGSDPWLRCDGISETWGMDISGVWVGKGLDDGNDSTFCFMLFGFRF